MKSKDEHLPLMIRATAAGTRATAAATRTMKGKRRK